MPSKSHPSTPTQPQRTADPFSQFVDLLAASDKAIAVAEAELFKARSAVADALADSSVSAQRGAEVLFVQSRAERLVLKAQADRQALESGFDGVLQAELKRLAAFDRETRSTAIERLSKFLKVLGVTAVDVEFILDNVPSLEPFRGHQVVAVGGESFDRQVALIEAARSEAVTARTHLVAMLP